MDLYEAFLLDTIVQVTESNVDKILFSLTDVNPFNVDGLSSLSFFKKNSDKLGNKLAENFHKQPDVSFGHRMKEAVIWAFDQGYGKVIVLGADSPHIQPSVIDRSVSLLDDYDVVLGPSAAGGIYLLGVKSSIYLKGFERGFENVELLSFTKYAIHRKLKTKLIEELSDIDQESDLVTFISWLGSVILIIDARSQDDPGIYLPHHSMKVIDRLGLFIDIDPSDNRNKSINKITIKSVEE